jgi:hypothetical protein
MAAATYLARIVPFGDPGMQVFRVTAIDPSLGIWPGPGGELPPYPDIGLPGPQPPWPPKPGGGGGPVDPGYSPPWAQIPVDPGYSPPWATPGPRPSPGPGVSAKVIPIPPQDPPVDPPEGMPPGSTQVLIWFGPGTLPAMAWVAPYASTGPVQPPEGA